MPKVRVNAFSLSIDGFGAGPNQSLESPLGEGGERLHEWLFPTRTFQRMFGGQDGESEREKDRHRHSFESRRIVTGPSFTRCTAMCAWNLPVEVGAPRDRALATKDE